VGIVDAAGPAGRADLGHRGPGHGHRCRGELGYGDHGDHGDLEHAVPGCAALAGRRMGMELWSLDPSDPLDLAGRNPCLDIAKVEDTLQRLPVERTEVVAWAVHIVGLVDRRGVVLLQTPGVVLVVDIEADSLAGPSRHTDRDIRMSVHCKSRVVRRR